MTDKDVPLHCGKWLSLHEKVYTDSHGIEKHWEFVTRNDHHGTVCVIAVKPGPAPTLVLVKQYRQPIDAWILEFPAGLIDEGESAADAALRELTEETGYTGIVTAIGPQTYNSAGLTDESVACVTVEVTGSTEIRHDPDEQIEVVETPIEGLLGMLAEADAAGVRIDAKLWWWASPPHA